MASVNKAIIVGNLGNDPEMRFTPNGSPVTSFSVATSHKYKDSGGQQQEETTWHRVITWNKTAENCNQYLSKGKTVYVEGRIRNRSYEGNDGVKRYITEIIANSVVFLSKNTSGGGGYQGGGGVVDVSGDSLDDLPF